MPRRHAHQHILRWYLLEQGALPSYLSRRALIDLSIYLGIDPSNPIISHPVSSGLMSTISSEKHPACTCSPTPSVGIIAAQFMELELEKDRWRRVAREWWTSQHQRARSTRVDDDGSDQHWCPYPVRPATRCLAMHGRPRSTRL